VQEGETGTKVGFQPPQPKTKTCPHGRGRPRLRRHGSYHRSRTEKQRVVPMSSPRPFYTTRLPRAATGNLLSSPRRKGHARRTGAAPGPAELIRISKQYTGAALGRVTMGLSFFLC
jgi:hypothetical protein